MNVPTYLTTSEAIREVAQAGQLRGSKHLLEGVRVLLDQYRSVVEGRAGTKARVNTENVEDDIRFKLGVVWACNWVLDLPAQADEFIRSKTRGEE